MKDVLHGILLFIGITIACLILQYAILLLEYHPLIFISIILGICTIYSVIVIIKSFGLKKKDD